MKQGFGNPTLYAPALCRLFAKMRNNVQPVLIQLCIMGGCMSLMRPRVRLLLKKPSARVATVHILCGQITKRWRLKTIMIN